MPEAGSETSDPVAAALCGADEGVLKLEYERLCRERDRVRDARGRFLLGLGPAPASAGIATAVAATAAERPDETLLIIATALLGLLVVVGMVYDGKPAYRQLRARSDEERLASPFCELRRRLSACWERWMPPLLHAQRSSERTQPEPEPQPEPEVTAKKDWYVREIERELALFGKPERDNHWRAPWSRVTNLQEGLDSERTGARVIGLLWVAVIGLLLAAVLS
jgi:hypothetical protein